MNFRELVEASLKDEPKKALTEAKKDKDESPIDENGIHKKSGLIFMNLGIADRHIIDPKDLA